MHKDMNKVLLVEGTSRTDICVVAGMRVWRILSCGSTDPYFIPP